MQSTNAATHVTDKTMMVESVSTSLQYEGISFEGGLSSTPGSENPLLSSFEVYTQKAKPRPKPRPQPRPRST